MKQVGVHFTILISKSDINPFNLGKNPNVYKPKGGDCSFHPFHSRDALESHSFLGGFARVLIPVHGAITSANGQKTF